MPRRVSLKGKGADLFFSDRPPGVEADNNRDIDADLPDPPDMTSPSNDAMQASEEPIRSGNSVSLHREPMSAAQGSVDSESANRTSPEEVRQAPVRNQPAEPLEPEFLDAMWERLLSQASNSNSFRYTAPELDELNDALYQVSKAECVRLTKQDIARLGLNAVLWDYRHRGGDSWLSQFARRKRQPRER